VAQNMNIINQVGVTQDPSTLNYGSGTSSQITLGNQGDQLASELHGKFYTAAVRGNVFRFTTAEAGVTIPIVSATAGVYMIVNPIGSGKVLEFIRTVIGITTATEVVGVLGFGIQPSSSATTYTTAGVLANALYGGGRTSVATVWTSVTQTAVVATGGNFKPMVSVPAVTGNTPMNLEYDFDGTFLLQPGYQVTLLCNPAAQSAAMVVDTVWAEWPYPLN
jgi:hypothetical protein